MGATLSYLCMEENLSDTMGFSSEGLLYLVDSQNTGFESWLSWFLWLYERTYMRCVDKRPNIFCSSKNSEEFQHLFWFYLLLWVRLTESPACFVHSWPVTSTEHMIYLHIPVSRNRFSVKKQSNPYCRLQIYISLYFLPLLLII